MEVTFITEGCTVNQHQSDKTTSLDIVCIEPQELKFGQLSHPYVQNFPEEDPKPTPGFCRTIAKTLPAPLAKSMHVPGVRGVGAKPMTVYDSTNVYDSTDACVS